MHHIGPTEALRPMTRCHQESLRHPLALSGLSKHSPVEFFDGNLHLVEVPVAFQKISQFLAWFNLQKSLCRLARRSQLK